MARHNKLTERDLRTLKALVEFRQKHSFSPSMRELCEITGLNFGTVQCNLDRLVEFGLVGRSPGAMRTLHALPAAQAILEGAKP